MPVEIQIGSNTYPYLTAVPTDRLTFIIEKCGDLIRAREKKELAFELERRKSKELTFTKVRFYRDGDKLIGATFYQENKLRVRFGEIHCRPDDFLTIVPQKKNRRAYWWGLVNKDREEIALYWQILNLPVSEREEFVANLFPFQLSSLPESVPNIPLSLI